MVGAAQRLTEMQVADVMQVLENVVVPSKRPQLMNMCAVDEEITSKDDQQEPRPIGDPNARRRFGLTSAPKPRVDPETYSLLEAIRGSGSLLKAGQ